MKHKTLRTLLCVILTVCFCLSAIAPVSAAGLFGGDSGAATGWDQLIRGLKDRFIEKNPGTDETPADPMDGTGTDGFYRIVHLDCGRKYFSKDWIIALLYEMKADGYNQLQLAFGNDGLRFLLDNMSFTANGTTYDFDTIKTRVELGNKTQNASGDGRWLTEKEMDEIINKAKELGIEIVPLLNLPGHANTVLCIANGEYTKYGTYNVYGSFNTINFENDAAYNFALEIFKKYVDYFSDKGCRFFSFGADEYANDIQGGYFSFSRLSLDSYKKFASFINEMSSYIKTKTNANDVKMTPRAFNDGLYYNKNNDEWQNVSIDTAIQCCYWSSGWGSYPVASASTISDKGHSMINTNGDFYYVLGKNDQFDSGYSYASNFSNTAFMGSTVSDPAGSMFCIWCDYPNAETETESAANTRLALRAMGLRMEDESISGMDTTAIVPYGFNADGTINEGSTTDTDVEVTKDKTITVTVGQTATDTIEGADYSNNIVETELDKSIATVSAEYEQVTGGTEEVKATSITSGNSYYIKNNSGQYLSSSATWVSDISSAALWTATSTYGGYTLKNGDNYLRYRNNSLSTNSWNATTWTFSNGTFSYSGWNSSYTLGDAYTVTTTAPVNATTVTFTGVTVGTTYVTVGNTRYTINVTAEDLSTVAPLTVEYWITNGRPTDDSNGNNYLTVAAQLAHAEEGIAVTSFVPVNTKKETRTLQFWRCRLLDITLSNSSTSGTEKQTEDPGDDETYNGVEFKKVRYWNGAWAVYTENNEWVEVSADHQLVAYYLEILPVAEELTVTAADWGKKGDGSTSGDYLEPASSCTLSIQVVYEDGTTNPASTTAADLKSSTIAYGYWSNGRGVGTLNLVGLEGYQIWKVEAETGAMTYASSSSTWGGFTVSSFNWDNNTMTVFEDAENPVDSYVIHNDANNPSKEGYYENLMWDENYEAILIKVYVKAPVTEDSLSVNYFVDGAPAPFYNYAINVKQGTLFDENIRLAEPWKGPLANGSVKNILGVTQTVSADLSAMPAIDAQYRYSQYSCIRVERSEDGKVVNLYYTFSADATFVVDFGLPVVITPKELNPQLAEANITDVYVSKTPYADVTVSNEYDVVYKLNKPLDNVDTFTISYKGTNVDTNNVGMIAYTINIIPATNVLYEENFITNPENSGWTNAGTADSVNQTLEEAGKKQNVYGYDTQVENYNSEQSAITYSMGGAYQATLNLTDLSNTSYTFSEPLKFTFEGTGIDLISECNTNTGMLYVEVIGEKNGGAYRALVDTYFAGDSSEGNTPIIAKGSTIYQVPVVRKLDLPYDKYTVTIKGYLYNKAGAVVNGADTPALASLYSAFGETADDAVSTLVDALAIPGLTVDDIDVIYMDDNSILNPNAEITKVREENSVMAAYTLDAVENTASSATVYVDGFRVYNPLGTSGTVTYEEKNDADEVVATYMSYVSLTNNEAYNADNEGGVVYYPAYDLIKKSAVESEDYSNGLLYVEYDGSTGIASIANYKNQGPQNEIYLAPGASIAFGINNVNGAVYQVSVREVTSGGTITNLVDSNLYVNSTEMYYNFTLQSGTIDGQSYSYAVFTNDKDGVVAVSGLKLSSTVTPYMSKELANMITEKLSKDPTAAFNPSMFEVSYPNTARKNRKFYLNVRASASDVVKVTLTVKDNKGNVVEGYNSLELSPSNSKAVAEGLSKYWMYDQSVKLSAGTYTIEITAYDKDNHTAVYKVSNADGEKAQPVITVK